MAPLAYWEASTSSTKGFVVSGLCRTGSHVTQSIKASTALVQSLVHWNFIPFFSRAVSGCAMCAKFRINCCWYPSTPRVLRTSLMDFSSLGHSSKPYFLLGSIQMVPWSITYPRNSTCHSPKQHFSGFKKSDSFFITARNSPVI